MHISKINHVYRLYFSAYQQDLLAKKEEMLLKLFKKKFKQEISTSNDQ